MKFRLLLAFVLLTTPGLHAENPEKTVRLLTVGNSFAYNATKNLGALARAAGYRVIQGSANFRGCSLELHWQTCQAAEAGDPAGSIYPPAKPGGPKRSLREFLVSERWDVITIQQASTLSDTVTTYRPFARDLHDYVKRHAPRAEVVFHQTWAYRHDDPRFQNGQTADQMHAAIRSAYHTVAGELGLRVVPVGDAFALATTRPDWTYKPDPDFDFQNVKSPAVPLQEGSLHVGWRWFTPPLQDIEKFGMDGHHANAFGSYLGSCVFFEFLFGESCVGNPFVPEGMTAGQARSLQEIAHQAVQESTRSAGAISQNQP